MGPVHHQGGLADPGRSVHHDHRGSAATERAVIRAGRAFAVATHGDAAGPETLRRLLVDWLTDMGLIQAGASAVLDAFIGYYRPYATSHEDLDADPDLFTQISNAALSLAAMIAQIRSGEFTPPDADLRNPREK